MNNKGFTLVEVLSILVLISIVTVCVFSTINSTMSVSKEEAYKLMKNNMISVSYDYVEECNLGLIECDFSFAENNTFRAKDLQNAGFFTNLESPIDGKDLSSCLVFEATKSNGVTVINLIDNCY